MSDLSLLNRLKSTIAAMGSVVDDKEVRVFEERPICGAMSKRSRKPCQQTILYPNGRCHMHGGPSTGPKTEAGREQQMQNIRAATERRAREREAADEQRRQQEERRRGEHPPTAAGAVQTSAVPRQALSAYDWYQLHSRGRRPRLAKM